MRLFLDANVLFSAAHNRQGNARALFPEYAAELASLLEGLVLGPEPSSALVSAAKDCALPEKDAPILAAAIAARADVLVTGDRRHFGPLYGKSIHEVLVLTPAVALSRSLGAGSPEGSAS